MVTSGYQSRCILLKFRSDIYTTFTLQSYQRAHLSKPSGQNHPQEPRRSLVLNP